MPTAAANRAETDIKELNVPDTNEPPEPLENGKPRRCAEFGIAASGVIVCGLTLVPGELKKGQMWYTAAHTPNEHSIAKRIIM